MAYFSSSLITYYILKHVQLDIGIGWSKSKLLDCYSRGYMQIDVVVGSPVLLDVLLGKWYVWLKPCRGPGCSVALP